MVNSFFNKVAKILQWEKDSLSTNDARTTGYPLANELSWTSSSQHSQNEFEINQKAKCER